MWQLLKIFINLTKLIVWLNYKNQCKIIYYLTSLINLQKIISKVTRYLIWGKIYLDLVIPIKFTRISLILPTKNSPLVTLRLIPSNQGLNPPPGETEQLHVPNCRDREEEYKGQRADPARLSVSPDSYDDACESICFIDRSGNHRPIIFLLYVERFFFPVKDIPFVARKSRKWRGREQFDWRWFSSLFRPVRRMLFPASARLCWVSKNQLILILRFSNSNES